MVTRTFQRTKPFAYVKLGRRTKLRYRRPSGRHNKSRQKWKSRPPMVEIGYGQDKTQSGLIKGKTPVMVYNVNDLKKVGKNDIVILSRVGRRNKMEIAKEAVAKKIDIFNLNIAKFLKECARGETIKKKQETKGKPEAKKEEKKHEEKKTEVKHEEHKHDEHKHEETKT